MADKPININEHANQVAAQSMAKPHLAVSFESPSVVLGATEPVNVEGVAFLFAYEGGAVTVCDTPGGTYVALEDMFGDAVVVTTARLIDVRGVRYIRFAGAATVLITG